MYAYEGICSGYSVLERNTRLLEENEKLKAEIETLRK
jgi:hypothetical protein